MNSHDSETGSMNYFAEADNRGGRPLERSINVSTSIIEQMNHGYQDVVYTNTPGEGDIENIKRRAIDLWDSSILTLILRSEGQLLGAIDFIAKGANRFSDEHVELIRMLKDPFIISMSNCLIYIELSKLKDSLVDDNRYFSNELMLQAGREIVGERAGLSHVMEQVAQVASLNTTVLILGETGVGKELIANAIHSSSQRRDGPFIKINCGAIPESLVDSELFGHEKGAFTGAATLKRGRFERANGGTIFLDEMGELPLEAQVRLLRVIQNREIERVGGTSTIPVDIRIICATHQNIEALIKEGKFREDLSFRINTFPIVVPSLRERKNDIPELVNYFLNRKSQELGIKSYSTLTKAALDRLVSYNWPGNVRELGNVIERELIQNKTGTLQFKEINASRRTIEPMKNVASFEQYASLDDVMTQHIKDTLNKTKGKIHGPNGAAELLDINPHTLTKRMEKLGILYGRKFKKCSDSESSSQSRV
ncbi:sigma-54 interaction domain-containing protein [Vibrio sp. RC27]